MIFYACKNVDSSKNMKKFINHSSIITKHWVTCVSIYFNKCKMQLVSNVDNWKDVKKIINPL
jgi:hypothetical protein